MKIIIAFLFRNSDSKQVLVQLPTSKISSKSTHYVPFQPNKPEPKVKKVKQISIDPQPHLHTESKNNLSKFLNKNKPHYLQETSGSK